MNSLDDTGAVSQIQNFCVHDGEGIRTTVFLAGCPLRCRWCANPETWDTAQARFMTVREIVQRCARDRIFYHHSGGGVTISGGEPGLQPQFLQSLVTALSTQGLDTALETSGYFDWSAMAETIGRIDFLFIDIKHMHPEVHRELTGQRNELILKNIQQAGQLDKDIVIRIPLIKDVNDQLENLEATAAFVRKYVPRRRIEILPYHDWAKNKYLTLGIDWRDYHTPSDKELQSARTFLSSQGLTIVDFK